MFSEKDIKYRTVLFLNAIEGRSLSVRNGELLISETQTGTTVSKLAFQKLLAVFVIGKCSITSPVVEALSKHGVAFCLLKESLRPLLWKADMAEGNYLLRRRQHTFEKENISIAKVLIRNKTENQARLLQRYPDTEQTVLTLETITERISNTDSYEGLMLLEAKAAKRFFSKWFRNFDFSGRKPRIKSNPVNASLDIGYTVLFNFVESNLRLFGFDLYVGVYHRLFFERKSLVCDIMEPFRCIVDMETRKSFSNKTFKNSDFKEKNKAFTLQPGKSYQYCKTYAQAILTYKMDIFRYVRDYYRSFMKGNAPENYPVFLI